METGPKRHAAHLALIVLVATASFGLGRLMSLRSEAEPLTIDYFGGETRAAAAAFAEGPAPSEGSLVASKTGQSYHLPWCPGAKAISESNRIWFDSAEEAKAAGYKPAKNCKGLE